MKNTTTQRQIEQEIQDALGIGCTPPLNRWALISYRRGKGRRLTARTFDNKVDAEKGMPAGRGHGARAHRR